MTAATARTSAWSRASALLDRLGGIFIAASAIMLLLMVALMGVEIATRALLQSRRRSPTSTPATCSRG